MPRGRTVALGNCAGVCAGNCGCGSLQPAAASGARKMPSMASPTGSTSLARLGSFIWGDHSGSGMIRTGNPSTLGTGEANVCGSRLCRGRRSLQIDERGRQPGQARWGPVELGKKGDRRGIVVKPGEPTRSMLVRPRLWAACPLSCCSGVTRSGAWRGEVGSV